MTLGPTPAELASDADTADLIAQARSGSDEAACLLLHRYRPLLARTVRRSYLAHDDRLRLFDVDDLWQEVRYAFLLSLHRYDPARHIPFGGYVKSLLPWHLYGLRRQNLHGITMSLSEEHLAVIADPNSDFVTAIVVCDLLARLPSRQAHVLRQVYLHDRPASDIARDLGITTRAVERMRRRAEDAVHDLLIEDSNPHLRLLP